ncbi:23S rRNA (adenine(2030)-N(6))-methyltransferase RlmJ [Ramlibacter henchirensis]|uniref:Ribosomal RNA large subunit methyltransferase J n=1 Tax=Ramlibacter henchirensis TaxID=204072 RepID=A0A4Z0C6I5_9BURK|nr:23S rRNA (adenine(2030)-N(6))-methyltransferase RlmJ [Ramlibacter henchirensis]TFZ07243.1 23S rRNA (adenine(2030)-N(6))-methyltransferase RlmJ [Ramlibacter henchirensis]
MFSYRHGFHAGNHADVFKHVALVSILRHLTVKETALWVIDTHAGAGLYRLDSDYAGTSGEAAHGVLRLAEVAGTQNTIDGQPLAPAIADYLELVRGFNREGQLRIYPGSPFLAQRLLREQTRDKLKLFELHPSDSKALAGHVAQLGAGRQVTMDRADGFEALKALLPPPSRRALVLMDPSYEIKSDYGKVVASLKDSLQRFATGTYAIWYPVIPRPEAHELPRRLKTVAQQARKPWLHASLAIGQEDEPHVAGEPHRPGLLASGLFVLNPPHTLKPALQAALPQLLQALGRGRGKGQVLESGA